MSAYTNTLSEANFIWRTANQAYLPSVVIRTAQEVLEVSTKLATLVHVENETEPLLIVDRAYMPNRLFLVRYSIGGSGEFSRPLYKKELTGYDCELGLLYPTQTAHLDRLQDLMESHTYGSSNVVLSRITIRDAYTGEFCTLKAVVSDALIEKLVGLYEFAW